jgi:hypothetical protein
MQCSLSEEMKVLFFVKGETFKKKKKKENSVSKASLTGWQLLLD